MTIQALIFDFDGLIFDSETAVFQGYQELYAAHGAELPRALWQTGIGSHGGFDPFAYLAEATGRPIDPDALRQEWRPRWRELCLALPLLPGVEELLAAATEAGLGRAVASSSDRAWVEGWLSHHGIREHFACVTTRDDVERVKPAPDLFLHAAACLGVAPAACLVLEDSPNGMHAARAAGMRCAAVPGPMTSDLPLPPVDTRLISLAELPLAELLARLDAVAMDD